MPIVKSFAVGAGDMSYIRHGSDNFTIIDCDLSDDNADTIIAELREQAGQRMRRFISTHPDGDHYGGIEKLDAEHPIHNFYVVENKAVKKDETPSFEHYCKLRDDSKIAYYVKKDCKRMWLNETNEERGGSGLSFLWPDTSNEHFKDALKNAERDGSDCNNISAVVRYSIEDGPSFMWLGDLETDFMEKITDSIHLEKTAIVFSSHHGRDSGKIPDSWLDKLDPQIIVIGEAPSRHLNYYTGYKTVTQNSAGDITMECDGDKIHFYVSSPTYKNKALKDEKKDDRTETEHYVGSITVEKEYRPRN
jgi:beta-lactamase superfamily II metal-dependent hydrolase